MHMGNNQPEGPKANCFLYQEATASITILPLMGHLSVTRSFPGFCCVSLTVRRYPFIHLEIRFAPKEHDIKRALVRTTQHTIEPLNYWKEDPFSTKPIQLQRTSQTPILSSYHFRITNVTLSLFLSLTLPFILSTTVTSGSKLKRGDTSLLSPTLMARFLEGHETGQNGIHCWWQRNNLIKYYTRTVLYRPERLNFHRNNEMSWKSQDVTVNLQLS